MDDLLKAIEDERLRCEVPGAAVAVVRNGVSVLEHGFGPGTTPATHFPIGSVTKSFTATAAGSLVDEGLLDWDVPVREYLPGFRMWDPAATEQLTVRDLLCHRSGLPRHDLVWYGNHRATRADLMRGLRHLQPSRPIRQSWQYSNLMYLAAGEVVAHLHGGTWEDAVRDRVLRPLGMSDTFLTSAEALASDRLSPGHLDGRPVPRRDLDLCGASGSMTSSAADLTAWLRANLEGGLVSEATLRELHRPAMLVPPAPIAWEELRPAGYALGWQVDTYRGRRVVQHGGNIDGYSSVVSFMPEEGVGVAVLTNATFSPLRDIVAFLVYDELLGLDPIPWGERHRAMYAAANEGRRLAAERRRELSAGAPPGRPWEEYAGEYAHPAYGSLHVTAGQDGLAVALHGLPLAVRHVHREAFELRQDTLDQTFPAHWNSGFDGDVRSVSVLFEPNVEPIEFVRVAPEVPAETLATLTGRYRLGPVDALVELVGGALRVSVANRPGAALRPRRGLVFDVEGQAGVWAEFVPDGAGCDLVVWPLGRFTKEATA
ncbi:serine hydrolase [Nonomuraea pusilla]|uniref:CubicO group peptidase, beta-lactamase class C family n=1 Tax=Nonomuraea pusilla TaxID=46177 RepID=A0A1H7ZXP0_9ACTN|nr:serine hydrolase [Nonomuraea pusilla]SEM63081.1 CubicO group peptidase, beta-lactamase class C family [Nonomuraea pusilla]